MLDDLDLIGTFRSKAFISISALIGAMIVAALMTNYVYLSFQHGSNVWFFVADRLAIAFLIACTILGYFGLFISPFGLSSHLGRFRQSGSNRRAAGRSVLVIATSTLFLGFLVGFSPVIKTGLRLGDDATNLFLLAGLEVAEAWLWQKGRAFIFGKLRHA